MTTLVVGATGLLGSSICRQLAERRAPLRALVRPDSPNDSRLASVQADVVTGNLRDEESLAAACRGCSAVITTANTLMTGRRGDSFRTVEAGGLTSRPEWWLPVEDTTGNNERASDTPSTERIL